MAPTCPQGCFSFFEGVSQLGATNMPPRDVYYLFEGWVLDFPSSSQIVPIKFILFSSISHHNPFVLIKFPKNSHQIPLVPINNPSKAFCSHQISIKVLLFPSSSQKVLIKFLSFPSITHQYPFVLIKFPSHSFRSHQNPFVPITMEDRQLSTKVNGETCDKLRLSAKQSTTVCGHAKRGAIVAGRHLLSTTK